MRGLERCRGPDSPIGSRICNCAGVNPTDLCWQNHDLEQDDAEHEVGIEDMPHDAEADCSRAKKLVGRSMTLLRFMSCRLRT